MDKQKLKNYIIEKELDKIGQTDLSYSDYLCGTGRACDQILDLGDESQANARNDVSEKLFSHAQGIKKNVDFIQQLNFEKTSAIGLGAVVKTHHIHLVIATSIAPFEFDNKQFVGVSTSAPLFKCLEGKSIGEECVYNDTTFTILDVY